MDVKPNLKISPKPWYRKTWGILAIFFFVILMLVGLLFISQVRNLTDELSLDNIKTQGFTESVHTSDIPASLVNRINLETKDDPTLGNPQAKVVVVEFGDFECPFCGAAFPIVREMQAEFKDQVLFIWRDLPLRDIHPHAQMAAEAGECAHEQGRFWEYHDKLFLNQNNFSPANFKEFASQIGLDRNIFDTCLDSGKYTEEVNRDFQTAITAGAEGTPTFFINGQKITGTIPRAAFRQIINQLLQSE